MNTTQDSIYGAIETFVPKTATGAQTQNSPTLTSFYQTAPFATPTTVSNTHGPFSKSPLQGRYGKAAATNSYIRSMMQIKEGLVLQKRLQKESRSVSTTNFNR